MNPLTFVALLALGWFTVWVLVNAAYDTTTGGADQGSADRIRTASRCAPATATVARRQGRHRRPAHDAVRAFYAQLPDHLNRAVDYRPAYLDMWTAFLFVLDHPHYRLRPTRYGWRVSCGG